MRVLAASFPNDASARAAQAQLTQQFALHADQIGVEPLAHLRSRAGPPAILAGRFEDEVVATARAVVEGLGGTLVVDIDDAGANA